MEVLHDHSGYEQQELLECDPVETTNESNKTML